jgi:2-oxoglutarate ferredoxin oxidoreductase subunit delta
MPMGSRLLSVNTFGLGKESADVGTIVIDDERCKGCGLCTIVCPKGLIQMSKRFNAKGYHPAELVDPDEECIACSSCALICPDVCVVVYG